MALLQVDFFSEVLGMCTQMSVILPQRTRRQIGMTGAVREGKYPAVFLLHGMTDDHTTWCRRTSIERYVSELGLRWSCRRYIWDGIRTRSTACVTRLT